jgi:hypothetical protein
MTQIHPVSLDPPTQSLIHIEHMYQDHMREGARLLKLATHMRKEADKCVTERGELRDEYRASRDALPDSVDELHADMRFTATKVSQDAKGDWLYFTRRAMTYSSEAAAQFAAAAAWMKHIEHMRSRNAD